MKAELLQKIKNKEVNVAVIGLGYVGLPLSVEKAKAGFRTVGFDIQPERVEMVNAGKNYIGDVVDDDLAELVAIGKRDVSSQVSKIIQILGVVNKNLRGVACLNQKINVAEHVGNF